MSQNTPASPGEPVSIRLTPSARIFSLLLVVILLGIFWLARDALAPYLLAVLIIYMLLPVVHGIERILPDTGRLGRASRPLAAIGASAIAFAIILMLIGTLVGPVISQTQEVIEDFEVYWDTIKADNPGFVEWYEGTVPEHLQEWLETHIREIGAGLIGGVVSIAAWLFHATGSVIQSAFALVAIPLFVVYYLIDEKTTARTLRIQFPAAWSEDAIAVFRIFDRVFGAYTRGVMIEALIVGVITGAGYWLIGVDLYLALGVVALFGEIVPIIGPWIAFLVSFPVVLATQPDRAIAAMLLFLVIQALEGWFLAPQIQGHSNDFTNSGTLVILAIGSALAGGLGTILALPAAGLFRALSVYTFHRFQGATPHGAIEHLRIFQHRIEHPPPEDAAHEDRIEPEPNESSAEVIARKERSGSMAGPERASTDDEFRSRRE